MSYNDLINLNVGGIKFMTSRQTLMREPGSLLGRMFDIDSPLQPAAMHDGAYFLDRDPKKFEIILNYLREDELGVLSKTYLINLMVEARYFQLKNLEEEIHRRLDKMDVYTFKHGAETFEVAKSYFHGVPLEAIINLAEKCKDVEEAFWEINNPFKASRDGDIIMINPSMHSYENLQELMRRIRDILVFHHKYVRAKATHINLNICGFIFKLETAVALKDRVSVFSRLWHDEFMLDKFCLKMDLAANILSDSTRICLCNGERCKRSSQGGYGITRCSKKEIIESFEKLRTCTNIVSVADEPAIDVDPPTLGIILFKLKLLEDSHSKMYFG